MLDLEAHPTLRVSRTRSLMLEESLGQAFATKRARLWPIASISAAGSLGRLEIAPDSDFDSIFLLESCTVTAALLDEATECARSVARDFGLRISKSDGIFREAINPELLLDRNALGRLDEAPKVFGKRIQILLDTRPLSGQQYFYGVRRRILDWYAWPSQNFAGEEPWEYLLSDLIRYANSYRNWQVTKIERTADDSWALRQIKLRSTRLITWMGLWSLILRASERPEDGLEWLDRHLNLTPLERIAQVFGEESPRTMSEVLTRYENILSKLQNQEIRAQLVTTGLPARGEEAAHHCAEFYLISHECAGLRAALTRLPITRHESRVPGRERLNSQRLALPF